LPINYLNLKSQSVAGLAKNSVLSADVQEANNLKQQSEVENAGVCE
jgi:hypothetical protein